VWVGKGRKGGGGNEEGGRRGSVEVEGGGVVGEGKQRDGRGKMGGN